MISNAGITRRECYRWKYVAYRTEFLASKGNVVFVLNIFEIMNCLRKIIN
jgi:hypothetical protein